MLPNLVAVLKDRKSETRLTLACLDLLSTLLSDPVSARTVVRWDGECPSTLSTSLLGVPSPLRRPTVLCLGYLSAAGSDASMDKHVDSILQLRDDWSLAIWVSAVTRFGACNRLKPYLSSLILPKLEEFVLTNLSQGDSCDCDAVETVCACLVSIAGLVSVTNRSHWISSEWREKLTSLAKQGAEFNPNFIADSDGYDYSDFEDDDSSWKIRKTCVALLPDGEFEFVVDRISVENETVVRHELITYLERLGMTNAHIDRLRNINMKDMKAKGRIDAIIGVFDRRVSSAPTPVSPTALFLDMSHIIPILSHPVTVVEQVPAKLDLVRSLFDKFHRVQTLSSQDVHNLHELLHLLESHITVVPSVITEIDLGPFKHKDDAAAPLRKAVVGLVDIIARKHGNPTISDQLMVIVERALSIGLSNSGDELFPLIESILTSVERFDCGAVLTRLPSMGIALQTVVDKAPVGKKGGEDNSPNSVGTALGKLVETVVGFIRMLAHEEGYRLQKILNRDAYAPVRNALALIKKDKTPGSILDGAKIHLDKVQIAE